MRSLELVKDSGKHGLGQNHVQVCQCLPGVLGFDGVAKFLIKVLFLGGQLPHTTVGQHLAVHLGLKAFHLLLVLLLDLVADRFHHLVKGIHKGLLVVVFQRLHHLFPDVGALHNVVVNHGGYSSFLVK